MEFWSLLIVAWMPILEMLLIGSIAVLLSSSYIDILTHDTRKHINKIVFVLFVPALSFTCLAEAVTLKDLISWWFMPVNLAITFFIGVLLGSVTARVLKPGSHLHGLIIACCSGAWEHLHMDTQLLCDGEISKAPQETVWNKWFTKNYEQDRSFGLQPSLTPYLLYCKKRRRS